MELFVGAVLLAYVVKLFVTDVTYARRGQLPARAQVRVARLQAAQAAGGTGAGVSGYVGDLVGQVLEERRARRADPKPRRFGAMAHAANRWERAWQRVDERHQQKYADTCAVADPAAESDPACAICGSDGPLTHARSIVGTKGWICSGGEGCASRVGPRSSWFRRRILGRAKKGTCIHCGDSAPAGRPHRCPGWLDNLLEWEDGKDADGGLEIDRETCPTHRTWVEDCADRHAEPSDDKRWCERCQATGCESCRECGNGTCCAPVDAEPAYVPPKPARRSRGEEQSVIERKSDIPDPDFEQVAGRWVDDGKAADPYGKADMARFRTDMFGKCGQRPRPGEAADQFGCCPAATCHHNHHGGGPGNTRCCDHTLAAANANETTSTETTGGKTMTMATGEALTVEQTKTNLTTLGECAQANIDKAGAAKAQAEQVSKAVENMAATMTSKNAHPDTLGDVGDILEHAQAVKAAASALAEAAANMAAAVATASDGVDRRDGLVAEVGASTGNVADRDYLTI